MPFSRRTVLASTNMLKTRGNAQLNHLELELGLENTGALQGYSLQDRANSLARFVLENPGRQTEDGEDLRYAVVVRALQSLVNVPPAYAADEVRVALRSALERDGFVLEDGELRRSLPEALDLPAADDEVHQLLRQHGFATPLSHLDQAIENHTIGNWASANGQLRNFVESLLDEICIRIDPASAALASSENRRQRLANLNPPFLSRTLNEWADDGKGFVNGFFRRLHPQGPHPGQSDNEDCTFRLHLVLICGRLLLRRFSTYP